MSSAAPSEQEAALIREAAAGRVEECVRLLGEGVDPNCRDEDGHSALLTATSAPHAKIVALLLQRGANPNALDPHGAAALHYVCRRAGSTRDHVETALLDGGADPNIRDAAGQTPLHRCFLGIDLGAPRTQVLTYLEYGADPSLGTTHELVYEDYEYSCMIANLKTFRVPAGCTVVKAAQRAKARADTVALLKSAASPRSHFALWRAALAGDAAGCEAALRGGLFSSGADVNAVDSGGWTALHRAAARGHEALVRLLLANGAGPSLERRTTAERYLLPSGLTPLAIAQRAGHSVIAELLGGASTVVEEQGGEQKE